MQFIPHSSLYAVPASQCFHAKIFKQGAGPSWSILGWTLPLPLAGMKHSRWYPWALSLTLHSEEVNKTEIYDVPLIITSSNLSVGKWDLCALICYLRTRRISWPNKFQKLSGKCRVDIEPSNHSSISCNMCKEIYRSKNHASSNKDKNTASELRIFKVSIWCQITAIQNSL